MSNKTATTDQHKKTFRLSESEQRKLTAIVEHYGFKTESSAISQVLESFMTLIDEKRSLQQQLRQSQEENAVKARLIRSFNQAVEDLRAH